jgi:hypothetical protein
MVLVVLVVVPPAGVKLPLAVSLRCLAPLSSCRGRRGYIDPRTTEGRLERATMRRGCNNDRGIPVAQHRTNEPVLRADPLERSGAPLVLESMDPISAQDRELMRPGTALGECDRSCFVGHLGDRRGWSASVGWVTEESF